MKQREVADQRMEALTLEFNTLTEEVKHLKQQRDQEVTRKFLYEAAAWLSPC